MSEETAPGGPKTDDGSAPDTQRAHGAAAPPQAPEDQPQPAPGQQGVQVIVQDSKGILDWIAIAVVSLFMAFVAVIVYDSFYRYRIVTVDISEFMADRVRYHYENRTPDDQAIEDVRMFSNEVHKMIQQEAANRKVIVLVAPAVVAGGEDMTPLIVDKIKRIQSGGKATDGRKK